jgi:hypothetical protein
VGVRRALILVAVLAPATLVVPAPPAAVACSIVEPRPTEEEFLARADVVFEGAAGTHRDPNAGAPVIGSGDPIFWTFIVDRVIKGNVNLVQEVASARSGVSCGIRFQEGARYRVYAGYVDGVLHTGLFSGTRLAPAVATTTTLPRPAQPAPPTPTRRIALTG